MSRLSVGLVLLFVPLSARGQDLPAPEKVKFETADGVRIQGTYYESPAKTPPVVIMLHNIGESSSKEKFIELARTLQPTFAVLTFDFRGHGGSTDIDPELYFRYPINIRATKGGLNLRKTKLDWREIDKGMYNLLVNDIAAAKGYIERTKNDLGSCNTGMTFVVGVEEGATLGAIWINSEWNRFKIEITPFLEVRASDRPEGQYLSGFVALSMPPRIGTRSVHLARTLDLASRQNAMPTVFVHGDGDPKDKASLQDGVIARFMEKSIKGPPVPGRKEDPRFAFTKAVELKGAGKLRGVDLLAKSLNTAPALYGYLKAVAEEKSTEWSQHEFAKTKYVWRVSPDPNVPPVLARVVNVETPFPQNPLFPIGLPLPETVERNIAFDTYETYIGR